MELQQPAQTRHRADPLEPTPRAVVYADGRRLLQSLTRPGSRPTRKLRAGDARLPSATDHCRLYVGVRSASSHMVFAVLVRSRVLESRGIHLHLGHCSPDRALLALHDELNQYTIMFVDNDSESARHALSKQRLRPGRVHQLLVAAQLAMHRVALTTPGLATSHFLCQRDRHREPGRLTPHPSRRLAPRSIRLGVPLSEIKF